MTENKHNVYIIKNHINDKVYIGQTSQKVHARFRQHIKSSSVRLRHSYKLSDAIKQYGKENFYFQVLKSGLNQEEADKWEVYYINLYDSYYNGYNSTFGANERFIHTEQDIKKLKECVSDGIPVTEISEIFQLSTATIRRTMNDLGIKYLEKSITKDILLKYKDTHTNIALAEMFNVSPATITRRFKKFEIKRGTGCMNHLNPQNHKKKYK